MENQYTIDIRCTLDNGDITMPNIKQDETEKTAGVSISPKKLAGLSVQAVSLVDGSAGATLSQGLGYANQIAKIGKGVSMGSIAGMGSAIGAMVMLLLKLGQKALQNERETQALKNEIDDARIKTGLLNLENTKVKTNWLTGKRKYSKD